GHPAGRLEQSTDPAHRALFWPQPRTPWANPALRLAAVHPLERGRSGGRSICLVERERLWCQARAGHVPGTSAGPLPVGASHYEGRLHERWRNASLVPTTFPVARRLLRQLGAIAVLAMLVALAVTASAT